MPGNRQAYPAVATVTDTTKDTLATDNKELVLHGLAEFAKGNIEVLCDLLHEDFIEHSPGNPSGRDAFIEFTAKSFPWPRRGWISSA
jgi:predicted SnoaL-like aldol condensation-catalyzing enzyme